MNERNDIGGFLAQLEGEMVDLIIGASYVAGITVERVERGMLHGHRGTLEARIRITDISAAFAAGGQAK